MILKYTHILDKNRKSSNWRNLVQITWKNDRKMLQEHLLSYSRSSISVWKRMKRRKEVESRGEGTGKEGGRRSGNLKGNNETSIKGDTTKKYNKNKYESSHLFNKLYHLLNLWQGLGIQQLVRQGPCLRHCAVRWRSHLSKLPFQY